MNILDTNIQDLVASQVITVSVSDPLLKAKELMNENNINHLSVTQNDEIVGMLFRNDLKKVEYLSDFVGGKTSHESSFSVVDIKELMTKCLMILREEVD
ncbi:MAG: CBS domain-containing protein [Bacteroidota bacterium]